MVPNLEYKYIEKEKNGNTKMVSGDQVMVCHHCRVREVTEK